MSAILSADDLNDFISPGVACIKPVETLPPAAPAPTSTDPALEHEVFRDEGSANANANAGPAQISLTDCLACSGCVTSAEAVLVSLQSHAEVLRALDAGPSWAPSTEEEEEPRIFVASVSPQTRANLAAACGGGVTEQQAGYMLEHLLAGPHGLRAGGAFHNGFHWVADTNTARAATLVLGADEALAATTTKKPLLTSSCPGWVCYAEKTHPHVLGYLSKVKSPQALMGTLLKTTLSRALGVPTHRIFHVAVMPCFDKKLEASREELMDGAWAGDDADNKNGRIRDVDCVITSKEVLMLAESRGIDFFSLPRTKPPTAFAATFPDPVLSRFLFPENNTRPSRAAGSSGGNLHFILQTVLAQNPGATLHTTRGRNIDVVEYSIMARNDSDAEAKPIFKAARYYGFRNIQNLVRRLRPARPSRLPGGRPVGSARRAGGAGSAGGAGAGLDFAYVEVMACPGGCTNGGGQIKVDDAVVQARRSADLGLAAAAAVKPGPLEQKAWLAEIDEAYFSDEEHPEKSDSNVDDDDVEVDGIRPAYVRATLAHWAQTTGIALSTLAYTTFREVVSDVGKAGNKAGKKGPGADVTEHVVQLSSKIGGGW